MKKLKVLSACLSALALIGSSCAVANDRAGAYSVRLADGYYFFASKRHLQNVSIPNLEVGYDFTDNWGIRAGAALINTERSRTYGGQNVHGFIYSLNGVYNFTQYGKLEPYVLGGVGVTSLKPNGMDPTNLANVDLGAGAQYFVTDSIAFGADARDIYTLAGGKNDVALTAGITFLFGGEKHQEGIYKSSVYKSSDYKGELS